MTASFNQLILKSLYM